MFPVVFGTVERPFPGATYHDHGIAGDRIVTHLGAMLENGQRLIAWTLLVAFLVLSQPVLGQENPARLDSTLRLLDPSAQDTNQLDLLIIVAESWSTSNKAFPYLERLDTLSAALLQSPHAAVRKRARHARGAFNFFTGYHAKFTRNIPLALTSFQRALEDFSVNNERHALGECYDALGILLRVAGDRDKAEKAFREELRIAREIDHAKLRIQALTHLAALSGDRGEHTTALAYLDSCGEGASEDSSAVLNERARILQMSGRTEESIRLLHTSLEMAGRSTNPWDQLPVLAPLARTLYATGRFEEGLANARACVRIAAAVGDETARCGCLVLAGIGERNTGDPRSAENSFLQGLRIAEENGEVGVAREMGDEGSMLRATAELKELYRAQGRTADALAMTERWSALKDSVQRMDGRVELAMLAYHEGTVLDSIARAEAAHVAAVRHEQELSTERDRRNLLLVIVTASAIIVLLIWGRLRHVRRTRDAIVKAQDELVASEKQREAELVRTRIARDVHDQLGSDLTKLILLSEEARSAADRESMNARLKDVGRVADEANRSLGDIVWAVDPHHDSVQELTDRIRAHCVRMLHHHPGTCLIDCHHIGPDRPLDPASKRDIHLMVREALNNTLKHARAEHITVHFHSDPTTLLFELTDDGQGLPNTAGKGHGMQNLQTRATRLGGQLTIRSAPSGGTTIRFELLWADAAA